ncbi:oligoribonuclease [Klebsiella pneumoniae]|nr:oligoribonuclease [Klebsiella pneumoniae]
MQNPQNLIWIDLEMTGLDPDRDVIIEMATIVTDSDLNTLAEGPVIASTSQRKFSPAWTSGIPASTANPA